MENTCILSSMEMQIFGTLFIGEPLYGCLKKK